MLFSVTNVLVQHRPMVSISIVAMLCPQNQMSPGFWEGEDWRKQGTRKTVEICSWCWRKIRVCFHFENHITTITKWIHEKVANSPKLEQYQILRKSVEGWSPLNLQMSFQSRLILISKSAWAWSIKMFYRLAFSNVNAHFVVEHLTDFSPFKGTIRDLNKKSVPRRAQNTTWVSAFTLKLIGRSFNAVWCSEIWNLKGFVSIGCFLFLRMIYIHLW